MITGSDSSDPPYVYAFERESGAIRWKREGSAVESDLHVIEGRGIGRTWNGDLIGFSLETGEIEWKHRPDDYIYSLGPDESPIVHHGVAYVGGVDGLMYAVDPENGETLWKRDLGSRVTTAPLGAGDDLFVGVADDRVVRLASRDGSLLGEITIGGRPTGRLTALDDVLVVLAGQEELVALERDLSGIRWTAPTSSAWTSFQPLVRGDTIVAGTREGEVIGLRGADGTRAWSFALAGVVRGLGSFGDTLYVGTLAGSVHACVPPAVPEAAAD